MLPSPSVRLPSAAVETKTGEASARPTAVTRWEYFSSSRSEGSSTGCADPKPDDRVKRSRTGADMRRRRT